MHTVTRTTSHLCSSISFICRDIVLMLVDKTDTLTKIHCVP